MASLYDEKRDYGRIIGYDENKTCLVDIPPAQCFTT